MKHPTDRMTDIQATYDEPTDGWYFPNGYGAVRNDVGDGWIAVDPDGNNAQGEHPPFHDIEDALSGLSDLPPIH